MDLIPERSHSPSPQILRWYLSSIISIHYQLSYKLNILILLTRISNRIHFITIGKCWQIIRNCDYYTNQFSGISLKRLRREKWRLLTLCACICQYYTSKENATFNLPDSSRRKGRNFAPEERPPRRDREAIQSREMISDVINCKDERRDEGELMEPVSRTNGKTAK
jgi:hypothetical protein